MASRLTVLLADDSAVMRAALREDLEREGFEVVAAARDGVEAAALALELRPALCLFDVNMPRETGLHAAARLAQALPTTAVVLISAELTVSAVVEALRAGAAGFLPKDIDPRRLAAALRAVAAGETAFPRLELRQALSRFVAEAA